MDENAQTGFDPALVPAFPVLTLRLDEQAERAELNGVPVQAAVGEDCRQAAIAAVVRQIHRLQLQAVRVRVLSPTDEAWDMVVTAAGDVHDTTSTETTTEKPHRSLSRRWLLIGTSALSVLALGGLGAAVALSVTGETAPPEWVVPGADQQIPVALPETFSPRSAWSVPVAEDSDVAVLDTGHILTIAPDGTLTARVPETGKPVWRGAAAPADLTGAVHTDWAGTPSLAATTGNELRLWDLHTRQDESTVPATSIPLERHWRVEIRGARPFVAKQHWTVSIPAPGHRLTDVVIPAGTHALTVTAHNQIITAAQTSLYTVRADGTIAGQLSYTPPPGVQGMPDRSWMLDTEHALLGWDTQSGATAMALLRVRDGATLAAGDVPSAPDQRQQPLIDPQSRTAAFETLAVTWGQNPGLRTLDNFVTTTVEGTTAYGLTGRTGPASLDISSPETSPLPWRTYTDADPAPDLVDNGAAYIVAETLEDTVLYRSNPAGDVAEEKEK